MTRDARALVDRIVTRMVDMGFPVEMTHKIGHRADHLPTDGQDWTPEWFEESLAWLLIGGWRENHSLIRLLKVARAEAFEEAAVIADRFKCGGCGMDGKAGEAIRALVSQAKGP